MGPMGVAVPSLCILAGLVGLQAMYLDVVGPSRSSSGFLWLCIMTARAGGPSLQGTILLAGTLVGLSKGLCRLDGVEHPSCASAAALPPYRQPALVLCACCIISGVNMFGFIATTTKRTVVVPLSAFRAISLNAARVETK